ncbi:MAG: hypothetical protein AAFR38_08300 [Planctomycetota bacterium]
MAILEDLGGEYAHIRRKILIGFGGIAAAVVVTAVAIGVSVLAEGPGAWRDLVKTVTNPTMVPIFFAAIGGGVIAPWFAMRAKRFALLRTAMLGHHRCPHCGYGIRSVPAHDGAVTCPECAAAWPAGEVGVLPEPPAGSSRRHILLLVLLGLGLAAMFAGTLLYWAF